MFPRIYLTEHIDNHEFSVLYRTTSKLVAYILGNSIIGKCLYFK